MIKKKYLIVSLVLVTLLFLIMLGTQTVIAKEDEKNGNNDENEDHIVCEQQGEHEGENVGCNTHALINGGIGLLGLSIIIGMA